MNLYQWRRWKTANPWKYDTLCGLAMLAAIITAFWALGPFAAFLAVVIWGDHG